MALLDEEIVEYWLNNKGFFCMRGVKTGLGEIDFLVKNSRCKHCYTRLLQTGTIEWE
tara:strand:- start:5163 stop:5333 length:171 start_codon:yes stop_codon:yes gene_type:complete